MDEIRPCNIVIGQEVTETKITLSRKMRREMTFTEQILWARLRRNGVGTNFRRQQIIDGFIADFYCHSQALVIEVDGPIHDPNYDHERDRVFERHGVRVLRFSSEDVSDRIGWVLSRIKQAIVTQPTPPLRAGSPINPPRLVPRHPYPKREGEEVQE